MRWKTVAVGCDLEIELLEPRPVPSLPSVTRARAPSGAFAAEDAGDARLAILHERADLPDGRADLERDVVLGDDAVDVAHAQREQRLADVLEAVAEGVHALAVDVACRCRRHDTLKSPRTRSTVSAHSGTTGASRLAQPRGRAGHDCRRRRGRASPPRRATRRCALAPSRRRSPRRRSGCAIWRRSPSRGSDGAGAWLAKRCGRLRARRPAFQRPAAVRDHGLDGRDAARWAPSTQFQV